MHFIGLCMSSAITCMMSQRFPEKAKSQALQRYRNEYGLAVIKDITVGGAKFADKELFLSDV